MLRTLGFLRDLDEPHGICVWRDIVHAAAEPDDRPLWQVAAIAQAVAESVAASLRRGHFPLVIGGDHSCAIGTWSGAHDVLDTRERLGLLWIDAHMDSHTFRTSPSRALHGMPLACLLGHGDPRLTRIGGPDPKLLPQDVCLIGVRSYEWGEAALLKNLGVRIYFMDEVHRRGLAEVCAEAWEQVTRETATSGIASTLTPSTRRRSPASAVPSPAACAATNWRWLCARCTAIPACARWRSSNTTPTPTAASSPPGRSTISAAR